MADKLLSVTVKGKENKWSFHCMQDPKYIEDWEQDGLDVEVLDNIVPNWMPSWLVIPYCMLQDIFNFKNPLNAYKKRGKQ